MLLYFAHFFNKTWVIFLDNHIMQYMSEQFYVCAEMSRNPHGNMLNGR